MKASTVSVEGSGSLDKMTCTSVVHAPNDTTKVECCLYLRLTYLTILGSVSCALEHSLGIMFVLQLPNL